MQRNRSLIPLLGVVLCVWGAPAATARGQAADSLVSGRLLRRACLAEVRDDGAEPPAGPSGQLGRFCLGTSLAAGDTAIPGASAIFAAAEKPLSDGAALGSLAQWETEALLRPGMQGGAGPAAAGSLAWQSRLIFALEDVIRMRVNEQIEGIGWERVQSEICATAEGTDALFPATCDLLASHRDRVALAVAGGAIREAAERDLRELPVRLLGRELGRATGARASDLLVARALVSIALSLGDGSDVREALERVASLPLPAGARWDRDPAARVIGLVSLYAAVARRSGAGDWTAGNAVLAASYDARAVLVNVKAGRPIAVLSEGASTCATLGCASLAKLRETASALDDALRDLRALRDSATSATDEAVRRELRARLVQAAYARLAAAAEQAVPDWPSALQGPDAALLARFAGELYAKDFAAAALSVAAVVERVAVLRGADARVLRATTFVAAAASAGDDASMKAAVASFVAPADRFRRKRDADAGAYLMLNAYMGVAGGIERACAGFRGCSGGATVGAISVPIVIEAGTPVSWGGFPVRSAGIALQVLDLGAITAWRLREQEDAASDPNAVEADPEVGFAQVFSPGAYLVLGFRGPFALALGGSLTPKLRSLRSNGDQRSGIRFPAVMLSFDVPLFP